MSTINIAKFKVAFLTASSYRRILIITNTSYANKNNPYIAAILTSVDTVDISLKNKDLPGNIYSVCKILNEYPDFIYVAE
jgi:hypothetical protein